MKFVKGDITEETGGCILQGNNASGGWGGGLSGAIGYKFPEAYKRFRENGTGAHLLGTIDIIDIDDKLTVINGYTQEKYGYDGARYADVQSVESVIKKACLYAHLYAKQLKTVKIGCGLGGLDWNEHVRPLIEAWEAHYEITVEIFEL